jgi:NADH-quinone oxidoreductase subunit F
MEFEPVLTRNAGRADVHKVSGYRAAGGYRALEKALHGRREEIIDEVKKSGLRGRGGAGFPAGVKWGFVPFVAGQARYLVCNCDESEPGTFKDRFLVDIDPHQLIEGCAICCKAVAAHVCYIYIRGEYVKQAMTLEAALEDAYREGILGPSAMDTGYALDIYVHRGAGAYICGEETGLLESLEGKRGHPRVKPPFPAVEGAFGKPTVINNVETLACVPHIVERGGDWFRAIGTDERNTGPKLYAVSGHVEKPGTFEFPIGATMNQLLEVCGGVWKGRKLKAFFPGGASAPVLTHEHLDVPMDFDQMAKAGSMLGSAAVMVMDDTTSMVAVAHRVARFFNHESCGQCTPCREGTNWLQLMLGRFLKGEGNEADLDLIAQVCGQIEGNTLCALGDAAAAPVRSLVQIFRDEFLECARSAGSPD